MSSSLDFFWFFCGCGSFVSSLWFPVSLLVFCFSALAERQTKMMIYEGVVADKNFPSTSVSFVLLLFLFNLLSVISLFFPRVFFCFGSCFAPCFFLFQCPVLLVFHSFSVSSVLPPLLWGFSLAFIKPEKVVCSCLQKWQASWRREIVGARYWNSPVESVFSQQMMNNRIQNDVI